MAKIITFPVKGNTNGYKNMVDLFNVVDTVESCTFYLETIETMFESGYITDNELLTLRRIGRQRRQLLANPPQAPQQADHPGLYMYTPEMGQQQPEGCQIEASRSYYGKHYFLDTPLELKGRGITLLETYKDSNLNKSGKYKTGWNCYQVTERAFEKIKQQYAVSMECCLD